MTAWFFALRFKDEGWRRGELNPCLATAHLNGVLFPRKRTTENISGHARMLSVWLVSGNEKGLNFGSLV